MSQTLRRGMYARLRPQQYEQEIMRLYGGTLEPYLQGINSLLDIGTFTHFSMILELCCGTGLATQEIVKKEHMFIKSCDANFSFLQYAKEHVKEIYYNMYWPTLPVEFFQADMTQWDPSTKKTKSEYDGPYSHVILSNAMTEIIDETPIFALAYTQLFPKGEFLFNVKIVDGKKSYPQQIFEYVAEKYRKEFPQGTNLADFVSPTKTKEDIVSLLQEQDFTMCQFKERSYPFSEEGQRLYALHLRDRVYEYLLNARTCRKGSVEARRILGDLEWDFQQALAYGRAQNKDFAHMKTELLICAKKRS